MANHKSSTKRAKQDKVRRMTNKIKTAKTRTSVKALREAITKGDKATALKLLTETQSLLAKLAKSPAMPKKTAARKTARLAKAVASIK